MKIRIFAAVLAVLAMSAVAYAFNSTTGYQLGKQDVEYTMATVASNITISKGQWVMLAMSDGQGYDSGAVVTNATASYENSPLVVGVADQTGDSGQIIRIITRGVTTAFVNGSDTSSASGISQGNALSLSFVNGAAGSVTRTGSGSGEATSAVQAAATKVCGIALATVSASDTGLYNKYSVLVTCR